MTTRHECTFKNCDCSYYIKRNNHRCLTCDHGDVWHSLRQPAPSDDYLSFVSPRRFARRPCYERRHIINIFEPEVPSLPESSDEDLPYCTAIEILPV